MEIPRHVCPRCGHDEFFATAHVTQNWRIDAHGSFIECVSDAEETTHSPDDDDIWTCAECGFSGAGSEFTGKDGAHAE